MSDEDDRLREALFGGFGRAKKPSGPGVSASAPPAGGASTASSSTVGSPAVLDENSSGTGSGSVMDKFRPNKDFIRKGVEMFRTSGGGNSGSMSALAINNSSAPSGSTGALVTAATGAAASAAGSSKKSSEDNQALSETTRAQQKNAEALLGGFGGSDFGGEFDLDKTLDSVLQDVSTSAAAASAASAMSIIADDLLDDVDDRLSQFQEDPLVKEALAKGVDLREYGRTIEKELAQVEAESVEAYINQEPHIKELHAQIQMCDEILGTMETLLTGFQEDLGSISAEIQTLQTQSLSMNIKLRNRKTLQAFLGNFLDEVTVPPNLIHHIVEDEVNEQYLQYLSMLSRKMAFVKERQGQTIPAINSIVPELDRLRFKAVEKVRDFLLDKVRGLKKPKTNPTVLQTQLIKYRPYNAFLLEHHPQTAAEIHDNYVQIMNNYYLRAFERYTSTSAKLQVIVAEKFDLLGAGESASKGLFGGRVAMKDRASVFRLGDRASTLDEIASNPNISVIVPPTAESNSQKFPFEALFRSSERMLMDNASTEYTFIIDFFSVRGDNANAIFLSIFEQALATAIQTTRNYVKESFDAVGLLLCVRINNAHQRIMQQRRIPCLEPHMNQTNLLFWPRFQQVMDLQIQSIKTASIQTIGPLDVQAHYVTRRYTDLLTSVLTLNEGFNDQPAINSMSRLRQEMEQLYLRFAADFTDRRNYLIYFINQYDLIIATLKEGSSQSAVEKELEYWNAHMTKSINEFVEEELSPAFGGLIQFVKQSDNITDFSDIEVGTLEKISVNFSTHWKQAITNINSRVTTSFGNTKTSQGVLQVLLRQLLFFYSKFIGVLEKRFDRNGRIPFRTDPVGLENVKFEIKRFLPNIQ